MATAVVVVGDVHPVDELALAGDVAVVGAGVGAGADERLAAADVGPDGREDHLGAGGEVGQGGRVGGVGDDAARRPARVDRRSPSRTCSSLARLRPARRPAEAVGAVCGRGTSAVSPPVNPVAPKRTTSSSRLWGIAPSWQPRGTGRPRRTVGRPRAPAHTDRTRRRRRRRARRRLRGGRLVRPAGPAAAEDRSCAARRQRLADLRLVNARPPAGGVLRRRCCGGTSTTASSASTPYGWDDLRVYYDGRTPRGRLAEAPATVPRSRRSDVQRHRHQRPGGRRRRAGRGQDRRRAAGPGRRRQHPGRVRRHRRRAGRRLGSTCPLDATVLPRAAAGRRPRSW